MNKLFTKVANLVLGLSLAAGVGVAVGSNAKASRVDADSSIAFNKMGSELSTTAVTSETAFTVNDYGFKYNNGKKQGDAIFLTSGSGYFYNTTAMPGNITKINVKTNSGAAAACSYNVAFSASAITSKYTTDAENKVIGANADYDYTCSVSSAKYFCLSVTAKNGQVLNVTVYYSAGAQKLATPTNLAYDNLNQRVTWSSVSNASSYKFSSNNGSTYTSTSTNLYADVSSLTNGTTYYAKVVAVGDGSTYSDSDAASLTFTKAATPVYSTVTVTGGSVQGTDKGSAYIQCSASATGTNLPASPSFTWYVTETNSYATTTSVTNKASIDINGKVTFEDNCTVYVWALAPDGSTHNTSGYVATAGDLLDPKGSAANPYTVTEAWNIADGLGGTGSNIVNNGKVVFVRGTISTATASIETKTNGATFDITDGTKTLNAYSISGAQATNSANAGYVAYNYTVVVGGAIIDYKGKYEVGYASGFNSSLYSSTAPKTVTGIAVQTPPTKTAYKANEEFNPAGLVITVTYSDSTSEPISYSGNEGGFSFSPTTITAAGNITITYEEQTCTQAVTLITVTNVTSVASAPSEVYQNDTIDPDDVTLNVTYSDSSVGTVKATSVSCDTSIIANGVTATATYSAATETKTANFTINVVKEPVLVDISDNIVSSDLSATNTSYANFSNLKKDSEAVYKGNTSLQTGELIGFRSTTTSGSSQHSGIVTTASGGTIYQITVTEFDHATRILDVYGSNSAYSDPNDLYDSETRGTKLGTLTQSSMSLTVTGNYAYVGVRSNEGLIKVASISFVWKVPGTDNPMTANPTLTLGKASISVGHSTTLVIGTTPSDSDEQLDVTSSVPAVASLSGTGKNYIITGLSVGSSTITVKGKQSGYQSTVVVSVVAATKTYEDKILTADDLGISAYDKDPSNPGTYSYDGANFTAYYVMKQSGLQFHNGDGYLTNAEELYANAVIKTVTLVMHANNTGTVAVYEGTSTNPSTSVSPNLTYDEKGVNTYTFNGTSTYFKIKSSSNAVNIEKIIIELADDADSVLEEARLAALSILTDLSGLCGEGGSGFVTQSDWNSLNSNLTELGLSSDAKLLLKNATRLVFDNLSQGGAEIENAMGHYDACVTKFGYTPFTGITSAQANAGVNVLNSVISENTNTVAIIIVISMVSVTAIGGYFFLKKRREQN